MLEGPTDNIKVNLIRYLLKSQFPLIQKCTPLNLRQLATLYKELPFSFRNEAVDTHIIYTPHPPTHLHNRTKI